MVSKLGFDSNCVYVESSEWLDDTVRREIARLTALQRQLGSSALPQFEAANDTQQVDAESLFRILQGRQDVHGIATNKNISNVISFSDGKSPSSVYSTDLKNLKNNIDQWVRQRLLSTFDAPFALDVGESGFFWYPKGGYMSWHTNNRVPGWRIYITHATEAGKSFFRYKHPETDEIFTSMDEQWHVRLFKIDPARPLWHAVYSETDRFSLGYRVYQKRWYKNIRRKLKDKFAYSN